MSNEQSAPKIAFKATVKVPINLKKPTPSKGTPPPTTKPSIFEADDDEDPEKDAKAKRLVTGFDQKLGAILHKNETKKEVKKEYIIPSVPNRDWKVQIPDPKKQTSTSECGNGDEKLTFGLNVVTKPKPADSAGISKDSDSKADHASPQVNEDDEEDLIEPISEQEAYSRDVYTRPDAPDLEAYNRMPVEEFGAALLRGMGWKSTVPDNTPKERADDDDSIEHLFKRPALLGLGAEEVKDSTDDKPSKPGMRKKEREYVPLLKVSKATGKVITDNEKDNGGKSDQFIHHIFSSAYRATVGCDFLTSKVVTTNGASTVSLQIWDTAGQERFNSIGLSFYRGTDVAVLVYDITNAASFSHLTKWLADFRENAQVRRPTILLVGNKVDKEEYRAVSTRQALEFATNNWGGQSEIAALGGTSMSVEDTCFEVSAKENIAVGAIFKKIADIVVYQAENTRELLDFDIDGRVDIEQPAVGASSRCC